MSSEISSPSGDPASPSNYGAVKAVERLQDTMEALTASNNALNDAKKEISDLKTDLSVKTEDYDALLAKFNTMSAGGNDDGGDATSQSLESMTEGERQANKS